MEWLNLFSFVSALHAARTSYLPPVQVSGGLLQGQLSSDGTYVAYYGVPYATVVARFQDAVPNPVWSGIKQANQKYIECPQKFRNTSLVPGQEDCLILNVYFPSRPSKNLRSVMVFIHGGAFYFGSGSPAIYGPEYFMKRDVVLVTINYRLGILGYLCLGIKEAPGNVGMKDQVLALKWVQQNIKSFGGDPYSVTIFGESAGGSSVGYHIVSPMSRGLFSKAIMQSGTALAPWAFQYDPVGIAHRLAQVLGIDTQDLHELVNNFDEMSAEELLRDRIPRPVGKPSFAGPVFVPCREKKIQGVDSFLSEHPYEIISEGTYNKVPLLLGYNNQEGLLFVGLDNETTIRTLDFYNSLPRDLAFPSAEIKHEVASELRELYMHGKNVSIYTFQQYSNYVGDSQIIYSTIWSTTLFLKTMWNPVYAYKFSYDGGLNLGKLSNLARNYPGATHTDDLFYMFKPEIPTVATNSDRDMISRVTKMWTDFAKYGDPTPVPSKLLPLKWEPATINNRKVFVIDSKQSYTTLYANYKIKFWNVLYSKFYRYTEQLYRYYSEYKEAVFIVR